MPGRPMRNPGRPPVLPSRPVSAPVRPLAIQRPAAALLRRAPNPVRQEAREIRRQAVQVTAQQILNRPRPVVRPAAPPMKIMPRQPAAPVARPSAPATRPPISRPPIARPGMPATGGMPRPAMGVPRPPTFGGRLGAPRSQPTIPAGPVMRTGPLSVNTAGVTPEMSSMITTLNAALADLQGRSAFTQIQTDLTGLETNLQHAIDLLEGARDQGYVYQKDLEEIAYQAMDQWQPVRSQVENTIQQQAQVFQGRLTPLGNVINQVNLQLRNPNLAMPMIGSTQSQVNSLLSEVSQIQSGIQNSYSNIQSAVNTLNVRLNQIHWALKQASSASFRFQNQENLVMAVAARWDKEGNEDPEGILYLSNKRLIFEQKEEIATKKVLFIALAKELVQQVLVDQPLSAVSDVKAINKGLFGNQDFIEVQFTDPRMGKIPFHLNGQDCKQWVNWIGKARSGEIEQDRFSGSSLSVSDLTGPLTAGDLMAVQNEVNALQDEILLKNSHQELAAIENDVFSLERKLADLRARGYFIEKSLESDIAVLATQWERVKTNSEKTIQTESQLMSGQMKSIQEQLARVVGMSGNLTAARPLFIQLKSAIASTDAQSEAAEATVLAQYDDYADEVETLTAHLEWVGWMLDAISTASFQLLATESGIAAVEATYARPGFEAENGILFLTDQRLLWEDRVGDFELKVEAALQQILDIKQETDESSGSQFLNLQLAAGLPYPEARFTLAQPVADDWLKMIGQARSGGYALDRAVDIDPAELERIRNAPQQCSNCGATLSAPILRGQTEIKCEYCGVVTRI